MNPNGHCPLFAYMSHHKCATRWVNSVLRHTCRYLGLKHKVVWQPEMFNNNLSNFVAQNQINFLAYTNANYQYVRQLDHVRGFHVVRDPRDICVSAYFSHLNSHETQHWPELAQHRQALQKLSKDDGLLLDMEFVAPYMQDMASWDYDDPNYIHLRMEELTSNPYQQFSRVFAFLGLLDDQPLSASRQIMYGINRRLRGYQAQLPVEKLLGIIWRNDFSKKSGGRTSGQEDQSKHYRKGTAGDWRNHFKETHIAYFKQQYNPLLLKLGYEQDSNW